MERNNQKYDQNKQNHSKYHEEQLNPPGNFSPGLPAEPMITEVSGITGLSEIIDPDSISDEVLFSRYPPTMVESVISGTLAAVCETLSLHWTTARRFREQLKVPKSSSIRVLYNSLLPDLISMMPITVLQVFFDSLLRQYMLSERSNPLSTGERMIAAAGAGFLVSPFPSYAEMLMLLQQKHSMKFSQTVVFHWKNYGLSGVFRGLPICAVRDSIYTTAYLGFAPWLSEYCRMRFHEYPALAGHEHWLPFLIAGPTGGLTAGILTQPLDCIKSYQQSSPVKISTTTAFFKNCRNRWVERTICRYDGTLTASIYGSCSIKFD
jgi:hypothetical protein